MIRYIIQRNTGEEIELTTGGPKPTAGIFESLKDAGYETVQTFDMADGRLVVLKIES